MTSGYLKRPLRTLPEARADIFVLGVKYRHLRALGKSTSGVLIRASKATGTSSRVLENLAESSTE